MPPPIENPAESPAERPAESPAGPVAESHAERPVFGSRFGVLATMIGVAVGLGNVWRFPYMTGQFGGAPFVAAYALAVLALGVPALAAEWSLGRATRRGPVGAFHAAGLPGGKVVGWLFFVGVTCATAYYTNAIGWVLYHAAGQVVALVAPAASFDASRILPPANGFDGGSFVRQVTCTLAVLAACAGVLLAGVRRGTERLSKIVMPVLLVSLLVLIGRGLALPGAWQGVEWYLLDADLAALRPSVILAAIGQAFFSLSLGGTFMLVYGSYLADDSPTLPNATWTAAGDLGAGLLAGLAILPAVIALGLAPTSGPGLLFSTLPRVFAQIPAGEVFGALFYLALFGAAFLSNIAAFEVLVAGLIDGVGWSRRRAVLVLVAAVFVVSLPPMVNLEIFVPWDLTFGSGLQTVGALVAVVAFGWCLGRGEALAQLSTGAFSGQVRAEPGLRQRLLYAWLRWVVPVVIATLGAWWLLTEVLGLLPSAG